jgi:hypothetical protein
MRESLKIALGWICIIAILFGLLELSKCSGCKKIFSKHSSTSIKSDTVTKLIYVDRWDSIKGKTITLHDYSQIIVAGPIDTIAVIQNFYRENNYIDTLKDSSLIAVLNIKVAQNKVVDHSLNYKITKPQIERTITNTITTTDTVKVPYAKGFFLLGVRAGLSKTLNATFGPEAIFVNKHNMAYGVSYDLLGKTVNGSIYIQLKR